MTWSQPPSGPLILLVEDEPLVRKLNIDILEEAGFRVVESGLARAMDLRAREYEIETEMLLKAVKDRVEIREVPVTRRARGAGRSHFRRFYNGFRILFWILRERFSCT